LRCLQSRCKRVQNMPQTPKKHGRAAAGGFNPCSCRAPLEVPAPWNPKITIQCKNAPTGIPNSNRRIVAPMRRIDRCINLCNDPPIRQKNVFFGVKRGRIQNKARAWKQGLKRPVEPPKPQYSANPLSREFRTSNGARQLRGSSSLPPRVFAKARATFGALRLAAASTRAQTLSQGTESGRIP